MTDYKETLNLPQTPFEMRAGLARKEPKRLEQWAESALYEAVIERRRTSGKRFVLHDGPPYANGHLHHGHILNKILKDIVVRDRQLSGHLAEYVPGWDCHGLPIEVQVDKNLGKRKAQMSKAEIRQECRTYAEQFVGIQRDEFKRLGVQGNWDQPYLTMSYAYEAQTVRELAKFARQGLLYRGLRPVNWCTVHQTALAEAEVEYEERVSPSIYVAFRAVEQLGPLESVGRPVDVVIWTTTPWTLPANQGIAVHPDLDYVAYDLDGRVCLVAEALLGAFLGELEGGASAGEGAPADNADSDRILARYKGRDLEGVRCRHPLFERDSVVVLGDHVSTEAGTGCVHTAPGHGSEDFDVGRRYGLEVVSPVDARGVFTPEAGPYAGQKVHDANALIIQDLVTAGALLSAPDKTIRHRYAHCWRCSQPIILRATSQWWVPMDKPFGVSGQTLRERSLEALDDVAWVPEWGQHRIAGMLRGRPDWCLSRQRVWGVPIAVVYCSQCEHPVVDGDFMDRVADVFEAEGADVWFSSPVERFTDGLVCSGCDGTVFTREEDILDVWFDSGVSFAAVVEKRKLTGDDPHQRVDLYLEGSDQHRGWFHSSLLCALATRERPPYSSVLTHGFVVDGSGKKISKSKGNFVDPFKAIAQNGAELLRLWVAAEDYRGDIRISPEILRRLSDTYRKIRNTMRYLLGNLHGFDPNTHLVDWERLEPLDRYALRRITRVLDKVRAAYRSYAFHQVLQQLGELCVVELSAFYLDVLKDRLYISAPDAPARRSAQTALYVTARDLFRIAAPVLCFTCDEAWEYLPRLAGDPESVHLALYPGEEEPEAMRTLHASARGDASQGSAEAQLMSDIDVARTVRKDVLGELERARRDKVIGASMEACVTIGASDVVCEALQRLGTEALAELFIVAEVRVVSGTAMPEGAENVASTNPTDESPEGTAPEAACSVVVTRSSGGKCPRCWFSRVLPEAGSEALCVRCDAVMKAAA